jgi:hypothetical protein
MSLNRGKRRRRERRRSDEPAESISEEQSAEPAPEVQRRRRGPKPLADRSPILPAAFAVICVVGAFLTYNAYGHHSGVYGVVFPVFYLVLALIEGVIAYKIFRARGGTWR